MPEDFRVKVGFFTHPKTIKLTRRIGEVGPLYFLRLIEFCTMNKTHSDGNLFGMDDEAIEIAAGWTGETGKLVGVLIDIGFIDAGADAGAYAGACGRMMHNFGSHNPWVSGASQRSKNSRKAAKTRWRKEKKNRGVNAEACDPHATRIDPQCPVTVTVTDTVTDTVANEPHPSSFDWDPSGPISTVAEIQVAVTETWGWTTMLPSRVIAKAKRIIDAGPIQPFEISEALAIVRLRDVAESNRASFFLGCVETARQDAATESTKSTAPPRKTFEQLLEEQMDADPDIVDSEEDL